MKLKMQIDLTHENEQVEEHLSKDDPTLGQFVLSVSGNDTQDCNTIKNMESENAIPCDSDPLVNNALDMGDIDSENTNSTVSEIAVGPGSRSYKAK